MLIDLPPLHLPPSPSSPPTEYTMEDYRDLFVDEPEQQLHFGVAGSGKGITAGMGAVSVFDGVVSDPESGLCTTSESELDGEDVCSFLSL